MFVHGNGFILILLLDGSFIFILHIYSEHIFLCKFIFVQNVPAGLKCDDTTSGHYRKFRHTLLADLRSGIPSDSAKAVKRKSMFISTL